MTVHYLCLGVSQGWWGEVSGTVPRVMHQSVWIPRGGPLAPQGILTSHPGVMTIVFRTRGSLTFKIKRSAPPGVGNRADSYTTGANEGGDFARRNFQMSESPGSTCRGRGTLVIHIDGCITLSSGQSQAAPIVTYWRYCSWQDYVAISWTTLYCNWGQIQLICCFLDPSVH